jgi:hypothetical protein
MGMQSFTFVAPGAMSPVPKLGAGDTSTVVQQGGAPEPAPVGELSLTLDIKSNPNISLRTSGSAVLSGNTAVVDLSGGAAHVTVGEAKDVDDPDIDNPDQEPEEDDDPFGPWPPEPDPDEPPEEPDEPEDPNLTDGNDISGDDGGIADDGGYCNSISGGGQDGVSGGGGGNGISQTPCGD